MCTEEIANIRLQVCESELQITLFSKCFFVSLVNNAHV